jgi:hypothetical protein
MKIALLYCHVVTPNLDAKMKISDYRAASERFVTTYQKFKPAAAHELHIACAGGATDAYTKNLFPNAVFHPYLDHGKDCGMFREIGRRLPVDWVIGLSSHVHFTRNGWFERLMAGPLYLGVGLFGPMGSYEHSPHLRTSCIVFKPEDMAAYPFQITKPQHARAFESQEWNYTRWMQDRREPVLMVTWGGFWAQKDWRKPDAIFRRGDQSNTIISDKNTDIYNEADARTKEALAKAADGY